MISYLNYNSTDFPETGEYNPSDRALNAVIEMQEEWEEYEKKVKKFVNANESSKVVIVSGASEAIATCMNWTRSVFGEGGVVLGSKFDHSSIKMNAKNYGLKYSQDKEIPSNTVAIVITHVDPKNGEIYNIDEMMKKLKGISYLSKSSNSIFGNKILAYEPLIFLDVSQSITKVPIDMEAIGANCLFFSLHKLGGEIGTGLMVVNDRENAMYRPLIFGYQQEGFRGGTYPLKSVLKCKFFEHKDDISSRKKIWEYGYKFFKDHGFDIYTPTNDHLYNTFLIKVYENCPLKIINALDELYGIEIGTASACKGEEIMFSKSTKNKDNYIRISFKHPDDINKDILEKIVNVTEEVMNEEDETK